MRITVDESLHLEGAIDLEVRPGTRLDEVLADAGHGRAWCGTVELDGAHPAGRWPFVAGARLSAHPRPECGAAVGLHLAAIAGPDAGAIIPIGGAPVEGTSLYGAVTIGSGTPFHAIRDPAMDAAHASISVISAVTVRVRDLATVNGTGVWALRRGTLAWRGRRRATTVRIGDVIATGHTLFELRWEPQGPAEQGETVGGLGQAPNPRRRPLTWAGSLLGAGLGRRTTLDLVTPLDATKPHGWLDDVTIQGEHAADLARAVILARRRRPPDPPPLVESWLDWLPPAREGDGPVRMGSVAQPTSGPTGIVLTATAAHIGVNVGGIVTTSPPVRVRVDTAEALARAYAGVAPEPRPSEIRWADAAVFDRSDAYRGAATEILAGAWLDGPSARWEIRLDEAFPHALIAGMAGSGKTTCLATLAGSLAATVPPGAVDLVIVCPGAPGPLAPCLDMPHVRIAATHAGADEAVRILSSVEGSPRLTVVIADDLHAYGAGGRAVGEACERLAGEDGRATVRLILATTRPAAVLSPRLRAAMATTVALRAASDADSEDVVGIADAAWIRAETPGVALVRTSGQVRRALVALPIADPLPAVIRHDAPTPRGRHLATRALRGDSDATRRDPHDRDPHDREPLGPPAF